MSHTAGHARQQTPRGTPQEVTNSMRLHRLLQQAHYADYRWTYETQNQQGATYHRARFHLGGQVYGQSRTWHVRESHAREDAAGTALPWVRDVLVTMGRIRL